MRIVALVSSTDHVCCRYRLEAFRPHLVAAGHELVLRALPTGCWSRWSLFRQLRGETVVLQRLLLPTWQLGWLRRSARRLIFDFDDAIFLRDSYSPRGLHHPRKLRRFAALMRCCDAVVAGNQFLAGEAARWAGEARVSVVPTCIDPTGYLPKPSASDGLEMVWIGSGSTLQGLERIAPLLNELGRRVPGLRLKVICDRFPTFSHLPVVNCPWSAATEAADLAAADIGISWVPDDLWSRGKCGLKVLQYMAAGLPAVANPVGVHAEMIVPGQTGALAVTADEWVSAIAALAGDAALRMRLGQAGRRRLEAAYTVESGWRTWRGVLEGLASFPSPLPPHKGRGEAGSATPGGTTVSSQTYLAPPSPLVGEGGEGGLPTLVKATPHRTVLRFVRPDGEDVHVKRYRRRACWFVPSQARREHDTACEVARRGVPTPEVVGWEDTADGSEITTRTVPGAVPLLDYLEKALPSLAPPERALAGQRLARALGDFLARCHRAGVLHRDLHPGNLLVRWNDNGGPELFLIDLLAVRLGRPPLGWGASRGNLIVLDRWFALRFSRTDRRRAWRSYLRGRADLTLDERRAAADLEAATDRSLARFTAKLDARCLGGNRHFRSLFESGIAGYAAADVAAEDLAPLLCGGGAVTAMPGARVLKHSRSSTVAEIELRVGGEVKRVIYKRFPVTAWTDPLASLFRSPPALRSYVMGHALRLRGLPTPRPLAVWHARRVGLLGEGHLLTEVVPEAEHLMTAFRRAAPDLCRKRSLIGQVARVLRRLHDRGLSHRDLKAANLLVSPRGWCMGARGLVESEAGAGCDWVWLIDLVGARRCGEPGRRRRVRDLARLLVSFHNEPNLTAADTLWFLKGYLRRDELGGWKEWWLEAGAAAAARVARNRKRGRVVG